MLFLRFWGSLADEVEAQGSQLLSGLGVIGLCFGAGFLLAVEIEATAALQGGRCREVENGVGAGLDRAPWRHAGLADHGGVHVARWMQSVDGDAAAFQLSGQV